MRDRLAATIYSRIKQSDVQECSFCYSNMDFGEEVVQLTCFPDHQFHKECYDSFVKHFESQNQALVCPLCRRPIEKDKVTVKKIARAEPAPSAKEAFDDSAMKKQSAT